MTPDTITPFKAMRRWPRLTTLLEQHTFAPRAFASSYLARANNGEETYRKIVSEAFRQRHARKHRRAEAQRK